MSPLHGRNTQILVDQYDLSQHLNQSDSDSQISMGETTGYRAPGFARTYLPGLRNGTLNLGGFWDAAAGATDAVVDAALGSAAGQVVTRGFDGLALGAIVQMALSRLTSYRRTSPLDGVVGITVAIQADGGVDRGISLHNLAAETTTGNGANVDNTASTPNGAVAHLHISAVSGSTPSATIKVQHSVDNSVWVDLITFTAATAVGSQRGSATGTVNRHLRAQWTISGTTPSFTFAVTAARR